VIARFGLHVEVEGRARSRRPDSDVDAIAAGEASGPLDPFQILTKDEIERMQSTIDGFNSELAGCYRMLQMLRYHP
jgi:hypothetical protein